MRSFIFCSSWKNDLSSLWHASEIMTFWKGEFPSKSKLIPELIFSELGELHELSWLLSMLDVIGLGGCLYVWPGWKGTSWIKGLVCVIPPSTLLTECVGSLEYIQFVFLVLILVSPGIFCESSDGGMIDWIRSLPF